MTSGGARARSGPPPDPGALRRDRKDDAGWVVLPLTGRPGDPPEWPLPEQTDREVHHWARLWKLPQATEWERLELFVEVALYVRRLCECELPGANAALGNHVIRLSEALGLTTAGLRVNRWHIGTSRSATATAEASPESAPAADGTQAPTARPVASRASMRGRLAVVRPDGDG